MSGVQTNRPWENNHSAIDQYTVGQTLLKLEELDSASFGATFTLNYFKDNYACDDAESGNPFQRAEELVEGNPEWQRRLLLHGKGPNADTQLETWLLCCPEDVQTSSQCKHDPTALCEHCLIPLCQRCVSKLSGLHLVRWTFSFSLFLRFVFPLTLKLFLDVFLYIFFVFIMKQRCSGIFKINIC